MSEIYPNIFFPCETRTCDYCFAALPLGAQQRFCNRSCIGKFGAALRLRHDGPVAPIHYFFRHIRADFPDGCWWWIGASQGTHHNYGHFNIQGRDYRAHRFSYEYFFGPIPDGLVIDHLCNHSLCVYPYHLEPTTQRKNVLRGISPLANYARQTHCKRGHLFDEKTTYYAQRTNGVHRQCRPCHARQAKIDRERKRE